MATIANVRLDDRLIHGQVAIAVLRGFKTKKLYIIDDNLVNDAMQKVVLQAVCPRGIDFELISTEEAGKRWQEDQLGKASPIILLFKDVENIYKAYKAGVEFEKVTLGGQRDISDDRVHITAQIYLNEREAAWLDEMSKAGVTVVCQPKPQDSEMSWSSVVSSNFPGLK